MIRGLHGLIYSSDAAASRAFVRDVLKLPTNDVGDGWLIFDLPEGDLGFHPIDQGGSAGDHDVSFYCDDIHGTVAELRARGVEFTQEPADHGYGWVTYFTIPGGITVQLYEPKYEKRARTPVARLAGGARKVAEKARAGAAAGAAKARAGAAKARAGAAKARAGEVAARARTAAAKVGAKVKNATTRGRKQ